MFTKLAKVVAILGLVLGVARFASAFWIAGLSDGARELATRRYLGSGSPGEYIDQGIYVVLFSIALGTVAEISQSLKRASKD